MHKRKVLFVNEASFIASGYGTYGKEIIPRILDSGKVDIAELSCSATIGDIRDQHINWRMYPNAVGDKDPRHSLYRSNSGNEHGQWRFDRVLIDYQPDFVYDIRDPWVLLFEGESPLRQYYHLVWMPTCDSKPQQLYWIDEFCRADAIFTYTEWAGKVLKEQSNNRINYVGTAPPGVDMNIFKPVTDKAKHKASLGLTPDTFIIGTVMRNQTRKLFPDLFQAFRQFLNNCYSSGRRDLKDLADKTFLYVHTSYPDLMSWDIPSLLVEHNLGHKVLFTYICKQTLSPFIGFFQDAITGNPTTGRTTGVLPNVSIGVSREELARIYNIMDLYVQYSNCEGIGIPILEAAACGVPVACTNYSAMEDLIKQTHGYPIKVERMFRDIGTNAYRALPDNSDLGRVIQQHFLLPNEMRNRKSQQARRGAEQYYDWDFIAGKLIKYFTEAELTGNQGKWDAPFALKQPNYNMPNNLNNYEFVDWCYQNITGETNRVGCYKSLQIGQDLNYGATSGPGKMQSFTRKDVMEYFKRRAEQFYICERARCNRDKLDMEDYLEYARGKER